MEALNEPPAEVDVNYIPGHIFSVNVQANEEPGSIPKYSVLIINTKRKKLLTQFTISAYIIPQGREIEWQYAAADGQVDLCETVGVSRLILITLNHGYNFTSIQQVQDDLEVQFQQYKQQGCVTDRIPFITDGDNFGERAVIFEAGEKIVEEVKIDGSYFRQLIFLSAAGHIQSEVRLKRTKEEPEYPTTIGDLPLGPSALSGFNVDIDYSMLTFEYQRAEVAGFALIESHLQYEIQVDVLVLGTGAGVLSTFLHRHFPQVHITAIDIDSFVTYIGKGLFGLQEDHRLTSLIKDARQHVEEICGTEHKYHCVLLDISSWDPNEMVPPPEFRSDRFLMLLKDLILPNGLLMINTISNSLKNMKEFKETLTRYYAIVYNLRCEEENNEIFYVINNNDKYIPKTPQQLVSIIRNIEKTTRWDTTMQIQQLASNIKLIHPYIPSVMPAKPARKKKKRKN